MLRPRLIGLSASVSPSRAFTRKIDTSEASRPIAIIASGKTRPFAAFSPWMPIARKAVTPRMMFATRTTPKDSNRSEAMPAQSPTLSPTLSAIVAGLRGSSSGMPASTFPTRSAPTSAALVKMPPPTRRNNASSEPPKPNPIRIEDAVFWKTITMSVAPSRPRPAVNNPTVPPARNATWRASSIFPLLAAAAVRTFALVASHMPRNPMKPEQSAPKRNARVRKMPDWTCSRPSPVDSFRISVEVRNTTTASGTTMIAIVRNWRLMYAIAPSCTAAAISPICSVPGSLDRTLRMRNQPATSAMSATTTQKISNPHSELPRRKTWNVPSVLAART